jgi:hypothetical protein
VNIHTLADTTLKPVYQNPVDMYAKNSFDVPRYSFKHVLSLKRPVLLHSLEVFVRADLTYPETRNRKA